MCLLKEIIVFGNSEKATKIVSVARITPFKMRVFKKIGAFGAGLSKIMLIDDIRSDSFPSVGWEKWTLKNSAKYPLFDW